MNFLPQTFAGPDSLNTFKPAMFIFIFMSAGTLEMLTITGILILRIQNLDFHTLEFPGRCLFFGHIVYMFVRVLVDPRIQTKWELVLSIL